MTEHDDLPDDDAAALPGDGGKPDGGGPDGGKPDGDGPDGGKPDGGRPDGGEPDGIAAHTESGLSPESDVPAPSAMLDEPDERDEPDVAVGSRTDAPQLTAMFDALVEDAPTSGVGPLTVLAEVRRHRQRRAKVGRGILAAAVVVGVFAVVAPRLAGGISQSNSGADVAMGAATSAAQSEVLGDASSGDGKVGPELTAASTSAAAAGTTSVAGGSVRPPVRQDTETSAPASGGGPAGGGAAPDAGGAGAETEGASQPPVTSAAATGTDSAAATLPPLTPPLLNAAVAALPPNTATGVGSVTVPTVGDQRSGSVLYTAWGGSITVVLTAGGDGHPTTGSPSGLVASDTKDGLTAVVSADPSSVGHVTTAQLQAVAAAVMAAMR